MRWLVDLLYLVVTLLTAPVWVVRMIRTGKIRTDWSARLGFGPALPPPASGSASGSASGAGAGAGPRVLVHAVSVGEVNAARLFVEALAAAPNAPEIVVAATTDTGFARAKALFAPRHQVVRYPFDFSLAVGRFLRRVDPSVVALIELEVWPNFTAACARRGTPVCVINGRLTERSARRYARVRGLVRPSFARLAFAAVQTEAYRRRFETLGVTADRLYVTGTMKWDTAEIADHVDGADALAEAMGIDRTRPLVVAGSTTEDEHALLHAAVAAGAAGGADGAQLLCAPRKPEWFDAAADALPGCARRSRGDTGSPTDRFLLDTIGELRLAYALADVVVIGRSFGALHGSDMMEPVALGKATIVGPAVGDFESVVDALLAGDGLVQTDAAGLPSSIAALLADPGRRAVLAANGRAVIRGEQGVTERHVDLVTGLLQSRPSAQETRRPSG